MSTQCLAEGVEDLQLEFGIDSDLDGSPNYFSETLNPGELPKVVVVRAYLLLRSLKEVPGVSSARSYQLGQKKVSTHDAYIRRVMSTTVLTSNLYSPLS